MHAPVNGSHLRPGGQCSHPEGVKMGSVSKKNTEKVIIIRVKNFKGLRAVQSHPLQTALEGQSDCF